VSGRSYRELTAWQRAMDFAENVYVITRTWPREELYGLTGQLRRAAASVPSNIAEGQGRESDKDFLRFLAIAKGSLHEAETQIMLGERLDYHRTETTHALLQQSAEVGRLLNGLMKSLRTRIARSHCLLTTDH